jgi:hypothetical protein
MPFYSGVCFLAAHHSRMALAGQLAKEHFSSVMLATPGDLLPDAPMLLRLPFWSLSSIFTIGLWICKAFGQRQDGKHDHHSSGQPS